MIIPKHRQSSTMFSEDRWEYIRTIQSRYRYMGFCYRMPYEHFEYIASVFKEDKVQVTLHGIYGVEQQCVIMLLNHRHFTASTESLAQMWFNSRYTNFVQEGGVVVSGVTKKSSYRAADR